MADFEKAYQFMAPHEWNAKHNYTNNPADPGGATKYGVTLATLQGLGSLGDLDGDGIVDAADVRAMTEGDAKGIYWNQYWKFSDIEDDRVAAKAFDLAVNLGPKTGVKYLQRAVSFLVHPVTVDGQMGPETVDAVNATDPVSVLLKLCALQAEHYQSWILHNPEREQFRAGLMARAEAIPC